jgi:hypothetical protein
VSSRKRGDIFARDNYCCRLCGISGGETYPDEPLRRAILTLRRVGDENDANQLVTVCERCHRGEPIDSNAEALQAQIEGLDVTQRDRLAQWMKTGRRLLSDEEKVWAAYRRLPGEARDVVKDWVLRSNGQR